MRTVYIPAIERHISLKQFVSIIKRVKSNSPDAVYPQGITCWWSCTGSEIMEQFYKGITQRINEAIPYIQRGVSQ